MANEFVNWSNSWLRRFGALLSCLTIAALPCAAGAQTRCDSSKALGHVKRLEGPREGVVILRVGGGRLVGPVPLTPVCPMDDIKATGTSVAHIEVYGATPVVVRSSSPWRPLRPRASSNMLNNAWAMVTDKFLPDLGRVQTAQRTRGGPLDPTEARIPSVRAGTDFLPIDELGGVIRLPVYGELWLNQAQLLGPGGIVRNSRAIDGQDIVFDATGLTPGRYEINAIKAPSSRLPPPTRALGAFTLVAGIGPTLETRGTQVYRPEMAMGLRALWLADNHAARHGLLAYQLATRARIESIPVATINEVVLKTLSPTNAPAGLVP